MNLVFSGPSGSGKGTITEILVKSPDFKKFVTCTTRKPRLGEKEGYDYYFLSEAEFLKRVQLGEMFNVKQYGENYYGSIEKDIDNIPTSKFMVFQLTPDRAIEMKKNNPETCLVLILPTSAESLSERRCDRSPERVEDDIKNLKAAYGFDYVVVNDDLETACMEVVSCVNSFKNNLESQFSLDKNNMLIDSLLEELCNYLSQLRVNKTVFDGDVAKKWDEKSTYVKYHGIKNRIADEVFMSVKDGQSIADIGCGTGKLLFKLDRKFTGCKMVGLDLSQDMINLAKAKTITGNNNITFINSDFMDYRFDRKFDIIIFSYVLHHLKDPANALKKAKRLLSEKGKIIFSVPGPDYLKELFDDDNIIGRFNIEQLDNILGQLGLYPLSVNRNRFLMQFNSYEMFLKYLKSIGTYQKIMGYTDDTWPIELSETTLKRFDSNQYISGEYLTYDCEDSARMLMRR